MAEVKLYGSWASPLSKRVEIALKLKGVEYDFVEEDMRNPSSWLLKLNPLSNDIPVLVHGGYPIEDSTIILEYIDETWNTTNPIWPRDPKQRAKARSLVKFIEGKCIPAITMACWGREMMQQIATKDACNFLMTLENELKGKKFFGGDTIGAVDIVASFIALWRGVIEEVNGVSLLRYDRFPLLMTWIGNLLKCNIIRENLPPRDKLLSFYRTHPPNFGPPGGGPPMMGGGPPMMGGPSPFPPR